jgi:hypothetical protein
MKQPKRKRSSKHRGSGGHRPTAPTDTKTQRRCGKNFSRGEHLIDDEFLRINFDPAGQLLEGKAAGEARDSVGSLMTGNVERLLRLALQVKDTTAKKWAGEVLANLVSRIEVEDGKLRKMNASYREWRRKIGKKLGTILRPTATISRVVQCELGVVERIRDLFTVYDFTGMSEQEAKEVISEYYWPVKDLPEFSVRSEPKWWKFLWPSIKKNYPGLLLALKRESVAAEKRPSKFRPRFRQHLQLLARRRDQGIETRYRGGT